MIFNCDQGTLAAIHGESDMATFEVWTDLGIHCLVSSERDEFGERYVDVPANWLHTEEEKHAVILQAQTIVDEYFMYKHGKSAGE